MAPWLVFAQPTWYEVPSGTSKNLLSIDFPSANVGYAVGEDSVLLKTTDGGLTWNALTTSGITFTESNIRHVRFVDDNIGYITIGDFGGVYKTLDGGTTWSQFSISGSTCYVGGMYWRSEDVGFVSGAGCFIGEQIDIISPGGATPATVNFPGLGSVDNLVQDIDFGAGAFGLAASRGGRILRTIDGGSTWDTVPTGFGHVAVKAVSVLDDTTGYASLEGPQGGFYALKSTDAGLTWSYTIESFGTPTINDFHLAGNGTLWSGGTELWIKGMICELQSGPGSWWNAYGVRDTIHGLSSYNDSVVWAVGDSGLIVVNSNLGVLGVSDQIEVEKLTVYPNPATNEVRLKLPPELLSKQPILRVYDASGVLVATERVSDERVDVSRFSSGVYTIQVHSEQHSWYANFVKR